MYRFMKLAGDAMIFDLRTIYAMTALGCIMLGLIQLLAFSTGRFERWLAWWSASNIGVGTGTLLVALRDFAPGFLTVQVANSISMIGVVCLPATIVSFSGRRVWLTLLLALSAIFSLPFFLPPLSLPEAAYNRITYGSAIYGLLDLAVAYEAYQLARRERLYSAGLTVGLFMTTGALYLGRALLAAGGWLGSGGLFHRNDSVHAWIGLSAMMFLTLRSIVITLMAAERGTNQMRQAALLDPLTGLLNRSGLREGYLELRERPAAVLVIDVDHFKQLNDTCGHAMGDEVLRIVGQSLKQSLRSSDLAARHGGDEFVVVLAGHCLDGAVAVGERIRLSFALALSGLAEPLLVRPTLSIGVAAADIAPADLEGLLHDADRALYQRKRQGRDGVEAFRGNQQAA